MDRHLAAAGALLAGLGIALGAFAAHGLQGRIDAVRLGWWETGVAYQMWGALGILLLAALPVRTPPAGWLLAAGILLFSGALYAMALGAPRALGMVAPVGGLLMIAGWLLAAWRLWRG